MLKNPPASFSLRWTAYLNSLQVPREGPILDKQTLEDKGDLWAYWAIAIRL